VNAAGRSLIIGTYTRSRAGTGGCPSGILTARYDGTGLTGLASLADLPDPSWVTATADGRCLYAVAETRDFATTPGGMPAGGVAAYARDPVSGAVTFLNAVASGGAEPAHLGLDPSGRFVVAANHGGGSVAVFAREDDGRLGAMTSDVRHQGSGVHPGRQLSPHPHQVCFDPVSGDLLVPDLGLDTVFAYRLGDDGVLTERRAARVVTPPGAGPRHLAFCPGGQYLFVASELDSTLAAWRRDGDGFVPACVASTLPPGYTGHNQVSAVRISPSGRSVLTANRGHESIAVFAFDPGTGKLEPRLIAACGGREPRDMVFAPDNPRRLLVANQHTDTVTVFDFDEGRPSLRFVSGTRVPAPACLLFPPLLPPILPPFHPPLFPPLLPSGPGGGG
jgi:6-phosphogluconolactonase